MKRECPSCGGSGGGPFGRAGSAWDTDDYVCPRCEGLGHISGIDTLDKGVRPSVAKAAQAEPTKKKKAAG
jgi:hypothetical protein